MPRERSANETVQIAGRSLTISHLDRLLWPGERIRKADVLAYDRAVAPTLLAYLHDRPATMRVFPRGVTGPGFYLRERPGTAPDWISAVAYEPETRQGVLEAPIIADEATLIWFADHGALEFHLWLSRAADLTHPDWAVFDLDPGPDIPFSRVLTAASRVRARLEEFDLTGYVKTSGGAGAHVFVPITPNRTFEQVRDWVKATAEILAERDPNLIATAHGGTHDRPLVTIDHAQNSIARNTAAPYTLRALPGAPVSTPLTWDEVAAGAAQPGDFTIATVPQRLDRLGDLWASAAQERRDLPDD